jgi:hypothetical protein
VEGFPFVHCETARFSDLDGMGHVNNAVFSEYIEQARLAWFGRYAADEPMLQATDWASIRISRHGHDLSATFTPSPALAREMAPTSGFSTADPWIRRNVVFSNKAGPEDGPIVGCLRGPRGH